MKILLKVSFSFRICRRDKLWQVNDEHRTFEFILVYISSIGIFQD